MKTFLLAIVALVFLESFLTTAQINNFESQSQKHQVNKCRKYNSKIKCFIEVQ
jgi:hypothetical protein